MVEACPMVVFPTGVLLPSAAINGGQRRSFPLSHGGRQILLPSLKEPCHGGDLP